jgi:GNAT superfamily N-acetyltransferase
MESSSNKFREIEHDGFCIKVYCTTPEHALEYGITAKSPLFLKELSVVSEKRNNGYGKKLLEIVDDFARSNNCDIIFGDIPEEVDFTKDKRTTFFNSVEMVKNWLFQNGYSINSENNNFHKVMKAEKKLRYYGGLGFSNSPEIGNYEIRTEQQTVFFTKLSEAKEYYEKIKGEKAFWDNDNSELLDSWYKR